MINIYLSKILFSYFTVPLWETRKKYNVFLFMKAFYFPMGGKDAKFRQDQKTNKSGFK